MCRQEGELSFHKPIGRPLKPQSKQRELERLRMEVALLKKFHTELRRLSPVQCNIRRSTHHKENFEVKAMCEFSGVSRAAYYAWGHKLEQDDPDQQRLDQIQAVYDSSHKMYGYRRITIYLQRKQTSITKLF